MSDLINGVESISLKIIPLVGGDVLHVMKDIDRGFFGFGEIYFSEINQGFIKGWKKHSEMVMNLIIPKGEVKIVVFDDRDGSSTKGIFNEFILSRDKNYMRVSISPGLWVAFQGIGKGTSQVMNFASIRHCPKEVEGKSLKEIKYDWGRL